MDRTVKTVLFWILIVFSAVLLWQIVRSGTKNVPSPEISYSTFIAKAEAGAIARVSITGTRIEGEYRNGQGTFRLTGPNNQAAFLEVLQNKGAEIRFRDAPDANPMLQLLGTWAPLLLLGVLWLVMIRQMQGKKPPSGPPGGLDSSTGLR